jgi:hypothetical protein
MIAKVTMQQRNNNKNKTNPTPVFEEVLSRLGSQNGGITTRIALRLKFPDPICLFAPILAVSPSKGPQAPFIVHRFPVRLRRLGFQHDFG